MIMKVKVFVGVLLFLVVSCNAKPDSERSMKKCTMVCCDELKVPFELMKKFYAEGMNPAAATGPIKCVFKCCMDKHGYFKNGKFDQEAFEKDIYNVSDDKRTQAELLKMVAKCHSVKGENDCDTAFKTFTCMMKDNEVTNTYMKTITTL